MNLSQRLESQSDRTLAKRLRGADGRAIVGQHLPRESQPQLRKLIESAIKPGEQE